MGEMQLGCIMQFDCNEDCACLGGIGRSDYSLVGNSQNSLPGRCYGGVPLFTNRTIPYRFVHSMHSRRFDKINSLHFVLLVIVDVSTKCTISLFAPFYINIYYSNTL